MKTITKHDYIHREAIKRLQKYELFYIELYIAFFRNEYKDSIRNLAFTFYILLHGMPQSENLSKKSTLNPSECIFFTRTYSVKEVSKFKIPFIITVIKNHSRMIRNRGFLRFYKRNFWNSESMVHNMFCWWTN